MGRLHCLHMYVVVFLPRPFFLLHTVQSVCLFFPAGVQGRLAGKWRSISLDWGGSGRCSRPWLKGASSLMSTDTWSSISLDNSILNCSWVSF